MAPDPILVPAGTLETQMVILYSTLAGVATTILGIAVALFKEARNRRWDLEDRALQREVLAQEHAVLQLRIAESNALSKAALENANGFNQKLVDIAERFTVVEHDAHRSSQTANETLGLVVEDIRTREPVALPSKTLVRVDETTQEISERVKAIEKKADERP